MLEAMGARIAVCSCLLLAACPGGDAATDAGPVDAAPDARDGDAGPLRYLERLETPADMAALQSASGDVKYLLRVEGQTPPLPQASLFQNTARYPFHLDFLRSFPETAALTNPAYESLVLYEGRVWWGGAVHLWPSVTHPLTGVAGVMSYALYADVRVSGPPFDLEDIVEVDAKLKAAVPFAAALLCFVPWSSSQIVRAQQLEADLAAAGVAVVYPEDLIDGLPSVSYSLGEGYGYLNVVPEGQALTDYGPRDVVIVDSAPNDISIVAGLISKNPQSPASHTNLRLQEKGIPNAAVPAIYANAVVAALGGSLVHIQVTESAVTLEPAALAEAQAFWDAHHPVVPRPIADLGVRALVSFADLGARDAPAYGSKAANLGELHAILPAEHRVDGLGVPFARYQEHIDANGLDAAVDALLANPCVPTSLACKRAALTALRAQIRAAPIDEALLAELALALGDVLGPGSETVPLRLRSSTNVEDLAVFTGAGLYDSARGCLADDLDGDDLGPSLCLSAEETADLGARLAAAQAEYAAHPERTCLAAIIDDLSSDLTKERTVARALGKVWASLWNEAAFDERAYFGIDHRAAFMGIAVEPTFVLERAEGVAFTGLVDAHGHPSLVLLVSQADGQSVVEPDDPTLVAEVLSFRRCGDGIGDLRLLVSSSLHPDGSMWSKPELEVLGGLLTLVHDHFVATVYHELDDLALDIEVKLDHEGRIVLKQVRPYVQL
jgi:pyruvate, water dikinase